MHETNKSQASTRVAVIADVESNARSLVDRVLKPAGFHAWIVGNESPPPDVLIVDVTQLRGDPLAGLRNQRNSGEEAPALVLAAHIPHSRLRDLFRLGVHDFLLKPYRPNELCQAINELSETRSLETNTRILARRLEGMREQVRRRSEEIRLLSEIGRVVVSLGDLDSILRRVVEAAAFVTDAEEASIYLAEHDSNELVLRASKHAGERHATLQRLRVEDTLVGEVFATGKPMLRQHSFEAGPVKVQTGFLVQSLVKVPLRLKNNVVGVLGVYHRMNHIAFNEHHLTLLTALAHWTGVALEQANLIQQAHPTPPTDVSIAAAPPSLIDGLEEAIETLSSLLDATPKVMGEMQLKKLQELHENLQGLRALPVATLTADETYELINLTELIEQVANEYRLSAQQKGLGVVVEHGLPIPLFRGDSGRTRRVIETLISAAIRRTNRGHIILETNRFEVQNGLSDGLPLPVNLKPEDGTWAAIRVSDSSAGLSSDTVRALTDITTDPSVGQMGPGLSMGEIRMIVESMGGILWYEQTPASSAITFALPIT
ncbi:MAG TPA: GAF domain-containing protein [Anaerolineae bacterium]|nr:GAF domain-containing protein [Anaerolineae bacterium]